MAGRRDFDFLRGQSVLTLTPDGRPLEIETRVDGRAERSVKRPGVLTRHDSLAGTPKRAEDLPSRRLQRVIDYIEAHLGEDLSLLTLATEAGMSPAHLGREFKRAMGRSPHHYLLGRRLEWAAAQLAGTEESIAEVAAAYRRQRRR